MTSQAPAAAAATAIDAILEHLRARLAPPRQRDAERLLRQFLRRVPAEELAARGPTAWAAVAAGLLEFLQVRLPDAANVRVFNPTLDEHGWEASHTVVEIATDDSPFLVDSVSIAIAAQGNLVHSVIHPVLLVERDPGGHVLSIADDPATGKGRAESVMHFEVDRRAEAGERVALREAVEAALAVDPGAAR